MVKRWIFYLLALVGCIIFFVAYQGWVAWLMMITLICLPLLSLLLSLIPMLCIRAELDCPGALTAGEEESLTVTIRSRLPMPPCRCSFRVTHSLTGESHRMVSGELLPTEHCGLITCQSAGFYVYDYLNLFRIRLHRMPDKQILVRPKTLAMDPPKELDRFLARSWQPKYGGGFSEQHELRLYRPGDGMNQIHWKLSAKTGKLIIREPMVPRHGKILLTMDLSGTPAEMDRKLGKLLWMGDHLQSLGLQFEIHALTGEGYRMLSVRWEGDLQKAIDALLSCTPATEGTVLSSRVIAAWQYHIGGDDDEA